MLFSTTGGRQDVLTMTGLCSERRSLESGSKKRGRGEQAWWGAGKKERMGGLSRWVFFSPLKLLSSLAHNI